MENAKKSLVVYYSRTGATKKVAEKIAEELSCDIEEIIDLKKRTGIIGFIFCGRDASEKRSTRIRDVNYDPSKFDLVIICTPIWAGNMTPAIRTYIGRFKNIFSSIAFLCTMGGSGDKSAFENMREAANRTPVAALAITSKEIRNGEYAAKIKGFINEL